MKNILFVASECVPFIKTGGLADVVGSLPKYFPKEYFDVRVVIPKYAGIKEHFTDHRLPPGSHPLPRLADRSRSGLPARAFPGR